MLVFCIQSGQYCARSESCSACYSHCYITQCPSMTGIVVKRRCARDAVPPTFNIGVFNSGKNNFTTIKEINNESVNLIDNFNLEVDTSDWWNFQWTVKAFGMESMIARARLRFTRDYLATGICSLIKPPDTETLMPFPTKINTIMLQCFMNKSTVMNCNVAWLRSCAFQCHDNIRQWYVVL